MFKSLGFNSMCILDMSYLFFESTDVVLKSILVQLLKRFDILNFMLLVVQNFLQISNLGLIEFFGVILAASDILKLSHQAGLEFRFELINLFLPS